MSDTIQLPSNESIAASYASRHRYKLPGGLSLRAVLKEDFAAHGRDSTLPGFRAVAAHRFAVWCQGIRFAAFRWPMNRLARLCYRYVRNHYGIELPYTVSLGRHVVIEHQSAIVIHGFSTIGDRCTLRQGVTLGVKSVDRPYDAPILGTGVDVGAGAKILGRITLGDGAKVGANAVVLQDVPSNAAAVGIPARIILARVKP